MAVAPGRESPRWPHVTQLRRPHPRSPLDTGQVVLYRGVRILRISILILADYGTTSRHIRVEARCMRNGTAVLLFVLMLSLFAADVSVGCGQHAYVYGRVTGKYVRGADAGDYLIDVDGTPYEVPLTFYNEVSVGQTVRFNGQVWSTVPQSSTPPAPASHQ